MASHCRDIYVQECSSSFGFAQETFCRAKYASCCRRHNTEFMNQNISLGQPYAQYTMPLTLNYVWMLKRLSLASAHTNVIESVLKQFLTSVCSIIGYYYGSMALCWALAAFSVSWSYTQSIGLLGRGISTSQGLYLHTEHKTETQNKWTHIQMAMPRVGFEPTIPVFGRAKTVYVLDRAATVVGRYEVLQSKINKVLQL
jgi:hypothetical protein